MSSERLTFQGAYGDRLAARLDRPDGATRATALFAHCFTCSKDLRAARAIARALTGGGIAVLSFDFTGLGESEGEFAASTFSSNVADLVAAADLLRDRVEAPRLLIGHSLGGAAALVAASRVSEAAAVVTIGAPSEAAHVRDTLLRANPELEDSEEAEVELAGRRFRIRRELLEDLAADHVREVLAALDVPLLVMHAPDDAVVGIEHGERLFDAARQPKAFVALPGADHLLTRERDGEWAGAIAAAWFRGLVAEEGDERESPPDLEPGDVRVTAGATGYAVEAVSRGHRWSADEPRDAGGDDTGPDPYELLLSALGACKAMTMRMYAERKGWPLKGLGVHLHHGRIHAQDCEECVTREGRIDRIETEIELRGPLADGQRERLLEIADRCPVHRTLTSETNIRSRLA